MMAKPVGQFFLRQGAGGQFHEGHDQFGIGRGQAMAVQQQEGFADHRRNPLVAIDKGMVARQPIGVRSRQGSGIRFTIMGKLDTSKNPWRLRA